MAIAITTFPNILVAGLCALGVAGGVAVAKPPVKPWDPPRSVDPLEPGDGSKTGNQLVRMTMSADVVQIKPGEKFHLAFVFEIEPKWHIYWENSGASGGPTEIAVKAPPNFVVGRTLFPRPQTIKTPEGPCYGYENRTVLLVEITPPDSAIAEVGFSADANWLVCKEICKKGSARANMSLPFGESTIPSVQPVQIHPALDEFKSRFPTPLEDVPNANIEFDGKSMIVTLPAEGLSDIELFPNPTPGVELGTMKTELTGGQLRITVPVTLNANNALGRPMRLAGVIGLGRDLDDPCYAFDLPLTVEGQP